MAGFEGDDGRESVAKDVESVSFEGGKASVAENEPDPRPVPRDSKRISIPNYPPFSSAFASRCLTGLSGLSTAFLEWLEKVGKGWKLRVEKCFRNA